MTEIEFLVHVLLTESVGDELKEKLLKRIEEVEKERNKTLTINPVNPLDINIPSQWITITNADNCQHDYGQYHYSVGDFFPRRCLKCQQPEPSFVVTSSSGDINASPSSATTGNITSQWTANN